MPLNAALEQLQDSIISGDPAAAAPLVRAKAQLTAAEQIAIYSNAYQIRLQHAVISDYPCLADYLGDKTMSALVRAYIKATPSMSYNLDFYPHNFWRFVQKSFAGTATGELAELEGSIAEVFMTSGTEPLTPENLPPMDEGSLGFMKFQLRQPYRLLRFSQDVENAMATFKRGKDRSPIPQNPIFLYVYRHNNEVQRRYLEDNEYRLLQSIESCEDFDTAIQCMLDATGMDEETAGAHVMRWLPRWMNEGFLAAPAA